MIDRTDFETYSGVISNVVSARTNNISFEFAELIKENTSRARERLQEVLSEKLETVDNGILTEEVLENMIEAAMSIGEGGENIWDIVLRLEKHVDPKQLEEIINMDFEDTAGLNSIAGLLARDWKKGSCWRRTIRLFRVRTVKTRSITAPLPSWLLCLKRKSTSLLRRFRKA